MRNSKFKIPCPTVHPVKKICSDTPASASLARMGPDRRQGMAGAGFSQHIAMRNVALDSGTGISGCRLM